MMAICWFEKVCGQVTEHKKPPGSTNPRSQTPLLHILRYSEVRPGNSSENTRLEVCMYACIPRKTTGGQPVRQVH